MIISPEQIKRLLVRYNGIGADLTADEREILLCVLYNESEDRGGIASDARQVCNEMAAELAQKALEVEHA